MRTLAPFGYAPNLDLLRLPEPLNAAYNRRTDQSEIGIPLSGFTNWFISVSLRPAPCQAEF